MIFKKILFSMFLTLTLILSLQAEPLNMERAEQIALAQNIQIELANKALQKSELSLYEAIGSALPTLSGYGQYTKNQEIPITVIEFNGVPMTVRMGSVFSSTGGASLSQPLFTGGMIYHGFKIAKQGVDVAKLSKDQKEQEVILTVRTLYNQIGLMESLIQATQQSLESATVNLEVVKKKKEVGTANQFEVLQAQVKYQSLLPNLVNLKNQKSNLLTNFYTFLNIDNPEAYEINGLLTIENNPFSNRTLAELKQIALSQRLELRMLDSQKKINAIQKKMAIGQGLPMVSVSADIRQQAQGNTASDLNYYRSRSTSLSVSVPLFSGGRKIVGIQRANITLKETDLQYQQMVDFIKADVESAFLTVTETESSIEANLKLVEQAKEALRLAKLMYENGSVTQLEVLNAESMLLQSESAYYSSIFQYNLAVNQLKKSTNNI